jgi:hypothetical protein
VTLAKVATFPVNVTAMLDPVLIPKDLLIERGRPRTRSTGSSTSSRLCATQYVHVR